jgi:hypothetical protein
MTSITTLHTEETQADHVDDGSKAGADQKAHALPGGRREEVRKVGGGGYVITMSNHGSK